MSSKKNTSSKSSTKPKVWLPEYEMQADGVTPRVSRKTGKKIEKRFKKDGKGGYLTDDHGQRIPLEKKAKRNDVFLGVALGELPGDFRVNEHGQLIIDELSVLAEENFVSKEALATLRTKEFADRMLATKETKANVPHMITAVLSQLRKVGFLIEIRGAKPKSEGRTRKDLRQVAVRRTKEEILEARNNGSSGAGI